MKISVIVPVYNMAKDNLLSFCLDSIINQTYKDLEIITVNDASTDESLTILNSYKEKYPDLFTVITYDINKKQGGARNEGLKYATGEWISFLDCDDWIHPTYFEKLINKAIETGADCVGTHYSIVYKHTFEIGNVPSHDVSKIIGKASPETRRAIINNNGSMVMKIYKSSLIKTINLPFPENMFYEDNAVGSVWAMYYENYQFVDEPLYYYYQRPASTVHVVTEAKCLDRMKAAEIMLSEMKNRGFYDSFSTEIEEFFIRIYFINTLFGYMIDARPRHLKFVNKLKKGMLQAFPNFTSNDYFINHTDEEQKRMVKLLLKNSLAFFLYYKALWFYRNIKKKL